MPRPQRTAPPYDTDAVLLLLRRQAGVVSRRQLHGLGVTPADVRRLLRRRLLFRLSPGMYVDTSAPLSPAQRAWWACLHYGHAAVADESALQLARDTSGTHLTLPIRIAVAAGRRLEALPSVELRQVRRLDPLIGWNAHPPRMQSAHAALRAASRAANDHELVALLTDAINHRLTTPGRLAEALGDLPALRRRRFIHDVLDDLAAGACSVLEREYLRIERAHGLPAGQRQAPRRTPEGREFRDVSYEDCGLVVELDGRAFHAKKRVWDNDLERDLDDLFLEKRSARLGWRQVFGTPCRTVGKIVVLLRQGGWEGTVRRCSPDCAAL